MYKKYQDRKKKQLAEEKALQAHIDKEKKKKMDELLQDLLNGEVDEYEIEAKKKKAAKEVEAKIRKDVPMTPHKRCCTDLNGGTKQTILFFFAYVSVPVLIVALVLTVFATYKADKKLFVDASSPFDRSQQTVLNGYNTWQEFTQKCCCVPSLHPSFGFDVTERWMCVGDFVPGIGVSLGTTTSPPLSSSTALFLANWTRRTDGSYLPGVTVDRNRNSTDGNDDGLPIRPVCGKQISMFCNMSVSTDAVLLTCVDSWRTVYNITQYAELVLW
jgi:hypothetical protein